MKLLSYIFPKKKTEAKCYDSIHTLPIGIYSQIQEGESLNLLVKDGGKMENEALFEVWEDINRQIVDKFGPNKRYIKLLKLKQERCDMLEKIWINKEEWLESFAFAKLKEIEALEKKIKEDDNIPFAKTLALVSSKAGFRIDPSTTTVYEFYGYTNIDG